MSFEHSLKKGIRYGFVPQHLHIQNRPELDIFPLNVLFAQHGTKNGVNVMGSALYEPDIASFTQKDSLYAMEYHNAYGGASWLIIEYNTSKFSYSGKKIVNKFSVGEAVGIQWNMFFVHFTALGLSDGEKCTFQVLAAN